MKPITRREQYLSAIAGESESVPTPVTREEILLQKIYESGGTGGEGLNPNLFAKKEDVAATYATKNEVKPYPDYAETEELSVLNKLKTFWDIENPVVIGFSTDQHINNTSLQIENNILPNLRTMADLTKKFPFNICVLGGDATATNSSIAALQADVAKVTECLDDAYCPVFHLVGNHDGMQNIPTISASAVFASHRTKPLREKYAVTTDESTNCYYDDTSCNIRFIMLVSQSLNGYPRTKSRDFLSNALSTLPNGYEAIIFSHHPLGNLTDDTSTRVDDWNEPLGWGDTVAPYKDKIIACISGHVHADKNEVKDGILYLSTTCAGWYELNDGTTRSDKKGTAQCTAYDVFVIDKATHTIHCVRYGIGSDREIAYKVADFVDVLPNAIDTDGTVYDGVGYRKNYRLNSSGTLTAKSDYGVTGFIPVSAGDTVKLFGVNLQASNIEYDYIAFYDANFATVYSRYPSQYPNDSSDIKYIGAVTDDNGMITQFTVPANGSIAYLRISSTGVYNETAQIGVIEHSAEQTTYTNVIPLSTNADGTIYNDIGYKNGFRLGSNGNEKGTTSEYSVTGFIPVQTGDVIRIKNANFDASVTEASGNYLGCYDSNHTKLMAQTAATMAGTDSSSVWYTSPVVENNDIVQFTIPTSAGNPIAYMRLSALNLGANTIITVNEEID